MTSLPGTFALGPAADAVRARLARLEQDRFAERLWERDDALWSDDPAHRKVAANRLGWLASPAAMRAEAPALRAFADEVRADGITHAVLLGMGGSSLAPEVLALAFGVARGAIALNVLDSTSPAAVRAIARSHDPAKTLFLVASKSGTTLEVTSFEKHFRDWATRALGDAEVGRHFAAITDPGTPLERHAVAHGYRRVFSNPADIGGRYSALSYFGLVPAALLGVDLEALLDRAIEEITASRTLTAGGAEPPSGYALGAALGELALAGREKVTLVLGPEFAAFGTWAEQLVAESTGKDGKGLVPIAEESLGAPDVYGADRVFVALSVQPLPGDVERALDRLAAAGHPVLRWRDRDLASLGAEFVRWEIATVVASAILGVDPFDEPNVTEAKQATQAVLERRQAGAPAIDATAPGVEAPPGLADALAPALGGKSDAAAWTAALLATVRPSDYVALLAYLHPTPERHDALQRLRHRIRGATRAATTLGYGPRFLHSTGQLHKGGPNTGVFVQLTADEGADASIPDSPFGFAELIRAQAAGDYEVLEHRKRRVIHVHLGDRPDERIEKLLEALAAVRV